MTPERLERVERLFHSALAFEEAQRPDFLKRECGTDEALRLEIERLLRYARQSDGFMENHVLEEFGTVTLENVGRQLKGVEPSAPFIGKHVGEYEIVARIGCGGMGEVYRAFRADNEYRQLVAIKLVSLHDPSGEIVSRLRTERQILAALDHPNIARLLDGGTTDEGIPFFVMELIEGQPIDEYCASHNLSIDDRLNLFLQVCAAVEYAHRHLIVHRDLKPANILVSTDGVPKLLDFGVAKILAPETFDVGLNQTATVTSALTPAYASPEQIKGQPVTTASDVYSLGVVLYELLSGKHPYRRPGMVIHDVAHAVCDVDPEKPSAALLSQTHSENVVASQAFHRVKIEKLARQLRGDLDTIVLTALRKEPERRYPSVERMANDLRRHLRKLPVEARTDTVFYRVSKFVSRHRVATLASLVMAMLLVTAVILIAREAHIARIERARAERRFQDVRTLANSLIFEIHDSIKDLAGATPARKLLVTRALEYLDNLSKDGGGDEALQRELATAYEKVGNVQGNPRYANLGDTTGALKSFRKALAIRESLLTADASNRTLQWDVFGSYNLIGWVLQEQGDLDGALASLQKAAEIAGNLTAQPSDPHECDLIAGVHWGIATILESKGDFQGALGNYRQASAIRKLARNPSPAQDAVLHTHLAADYAGTARVLASLGQTDSALQIQRQATELLKEQLDADTKNATLRKFLGDSYLSTGHFLAAKDKLREAMLHYRKAEQIYATLSAADPTNMWCSDSLGFAKVYIGDLFIRENKPGPAMVSYRAAVAIFERRSPPAATNPDAMADLAAAYAGIGSAYERRLKVPHLSNKAKLEGWYVACSFYQRSVDSWNILRERGDLNSKSRVEAANDANRGLTRCETTLDSLH